MVSEACVLETGRLIVAEWHSRFVAADDPAGLPATISQLLTPAVTASLPPAWQGSYSLGRSAEWIDERDAVGPTLLALHREKRVPAGLLVLFESPVDGSDRIDVRLGYLLAEAMWGSGLGGEMVAAYVEWCRAQPDIVSISAGVAEENAASIRILERNGFERAGADGAESERQYRVDVSS